MSEDLFSAIDRHDVARVAELLAGGADPNARQDACLGLRPLHVAINAITCRDDERSGLEMITLLLAHGADVNGWNASKDHTPLLSAFFEEQRAAAELLLAAGADPNARSSEGDSPLRMAVEAGDRGMVALLLGAGAARTIDEFGGLSGLTPLALAAQRLDVPMIEMLLDAGADAKARCDYGYRADQCLPSREESDSEIWDAVFQMLWKRAFPGAPTEAG